MPRGSPWLPAFAAIVFGAGVAGAHPLAPAGLVIDEGEGGHLAVELRWAQGDPPQLQLPSHCAPIGAAQPELRADRNVLRSEASCAPGTLAGHRLRVDGLRPGKGTLVLQLRLHDGAEHQALLNAETPVFDIPQSSGPTAVLGRYLRLGITHLLGGADHLLFLLGLLLLVRGWRPLVLTITAFTLGHGFTLALAAAGWLSLPQLWAEIGIALSLIWVGLELGRGTPPRPRVLLAGAFGLVHGLGFAGALLEVGLPSHALWPALLGFNFGVELAQLAIALVALSLLRTLPTLRVPAVAAHAIGACAVFWLVERVLLLF